MHGVGVDIIEIGRIRSAVRRWDRRFLRHVFLGAEADYCMSRREPARHFAARFAAKEAVIKALAVERGMTFLWRDIEILRDSHGAPSVRLGGRARAVARRKGMERVHVSLSHSETHAVAMATAS